MSLKAKLEAVIYAAEEPVTLAQLAALFAAEALEWKAEVQAASAEQIAAAGVREPLSLLSGEPPDADEAELVTEVAEPEIEPPAEEQAATEAAPEGDEIAAVEDASEAASDVDTEAEAKRLARLQDREARTVIRKLLDELIAEYSGEDRGIEIREIAGGYRVATKPEYHDSVRSFVKSLKPALRLSLPALETLAVIAYKQPVTAPEVNEIRGVDSSGVFGSLLARKLIATAGRKQVIGRPILYKTTREFLLRFGLKDVAELPSMEEFEKLAAIELDEPEFASQQEAAPTGESRPSEHPEFEFDRNGSAPADEKTGDGTEPESAVVPAAMAVSPDPARLAATPADSDSAEAAPAAPSSPEQAETEK